MDNAKRTSTVSARIPSDLEAALQQMALAEHTSVSDLICQVLIAEAHREAACGRSGGAEC